VEGYRQLGSEQRIWIEALLGAGYSGSQIAQRLGCHRSTISRELRRNGSGAGYGAATAQQRAGARVRGRPACRVELPGPGCPRGNGLWRFVWRGLSCGWSPELIAGRWRLEHPGSRLHHETLYRCIYGRARQQRLWEWLPQRRRQRRRRSARRVPRPLWSWARPLTDRPPAVQLRQVPGHWEVDLLCFAAPGAVILHAVERASRYGLCLLLPGKDSTGLAAALGARVAAWPRRLLRSLTCDRGTEFTELHRLGRTVYACRPYAAWEKGTVEQQNGVLRRYLPRSTVLATLEQQELDDIRNELNDRPMKSLAFRTPRETLSSLLRRPVALHL
jgi:IS30 family transposase